MSTQQYTGSCQCGAVAFEVDADLQNTVICNCSRCRRIASVLTFVPDSAVRFTREGETTEYRFNNHAISHRFCPVCGVQTHATGEKDGQKLVAINVNCLDGVDARALQSRFVNGAAS